MNLRGTQNSSTSIGLKSSSKKQIVSENKLDDKLRPNKIESSKKQLKVQPKLIQRGYGPKCVLKSLQKNKQSTPYRLTIKRIYNMQLSNKKSSENNFLKLFITSYYTKHPSNKQTTLIQQLGQTVEYQCLQALFKKDQTQHAFPISFFYHTSLDKNKNNLFFDVQLAFITISKGIVQSITNIGRFFIQRPFIQAEQKATSILKDNINPIDFIFQSQVSNPSKSTISAGYIDYQIASCLQYKRLTKITPQNRIFSPNDNLLSLMQGLPKQIQQKQLIQSPCLKIRIKYLQVHIPQTFQVSVLQKLSLHQSSPIRPKQQIKSRKLIIGQHDQTNNTIINSCAKKLDLVEKQGKGQYRMIIMQAIKEAQFINLPFYLNDQGSIVVVLIYQISNLQIQVAHFKFNPLIDGSNVDISQQMITTNTNPLKASFIVPNNSIRKPTIIMQYMSQDILSVAGYEDQSIINISAHEFGRLSSHNMQKSSHKMLQSRTQQLKEKQRLIQELQFQKLALQKQKIMISKLKNQNYQSFQQQFQRKLEIQKQALMKRQQMLENQYKEQVQRQIRERVQLEHQIRQMKDRLNKIQVQKEDTGHKSQAHSRAHSHFYEGQYQHKQNYQIHPNTVYRTQKSHLPNQIQDIRQDHLMERIDPGYLIEPENQIPVKQVRELLKTSKIPIQSIQSSKSEFNRATKITLSLLSILWFPPGPSPKCLYFMIRLFNFPQFRTETLTYLQNNVYNQHCQLVKLSHYIYNVSDKSSNPQYVFVVDPSEYKNPKQLQSDFIDYLVNNNCIIDVFDGQTHIYLGQINIKLAELIRANKKQSFLAKQYNLMKIKSRKAVGMMQLLIKSQQTSCKQVIDTKQNSSVSALRKKVISYTPLSLPVQWLNSTQKNSNSQPQSNRIEQRIQKFKQKQKAKQLNESGNFKTLNQIDKTNVIGRITNYKQKNMSQYIRNVYAGLLQDNIVISAQFGTATTFPYTFVNQTNFAASYQIVIQEQQQQHVQDTNLRDIHQDKAQKKRNNLQVIKQSNQWRYYIKKKGYMQPKFYEIINESNTFYLNAGQSLPMIFKYLSFDNAEMTKKSSGIIINVLIVKIDTNWIAGGFSLTIQLHPQITYHSYIMYCPGNQVLDIILPVIYSTSDSPSSVKKLHLTTQDNQTQAQWLNQYEILLKVATPDIMGKKTFNLLLYEDQYFDRVRENWLVNFTGYQGLWVQARQDSSTKFKFSLPNHTISTSLGLSLYASSLANNLLLNSSDPSLVFEQKKFTVQFDRLQHGGAYEIWCQLEPTQNLRKQIEITCTSEQNDTLVYGWILQVLPYTVRG